MAGIALLGSGRGLCWEGLLFRWPFGTACGLALPSYRRLHILGEWMAFRLCVVFLVGDTKPTSVVFDPVGTTGISFSGQNGVFFGSR